MKMGTRTFVEHFDDIDGTTGDDINTIPFALEGVTYEIDLNEINLKALREALSPFIEKGRRTGGRRAPAKTSMAPSGREIRDWARTQGIDVPARGIIPNAVKEAFAAAH